MWKDPLGTLDSIMSLLIRFIADLSLLNHPFSISFGAMTTWWQDSHISEIEYITLLSTLTGFLGSFIAPNHTLLNKNTLNILSPFKKSQNLSSNFVIVIKLAILNRTRCFVHKAERMEGLHYKHPVCLQVNTRIEEYISRTSTSQGIFLWHSCAESLGRWIYEAWSDNCRLLSQTFVQHRNSQVRFLLRQFSGRGKGIKDVFSLLATDLQTKRRLHRILEDVGTSRSACWFLHSHSDENTDSSNEILVPLQSVRENKCVLERKLTPRHLSQ